MPPLITPAELPKWVPGRVLAQSDDLGWNGVALRSYRYTGLDVEVPGLSDFIVVAYRRGATPMQRRFDGAWTCTECEPGDVSLLTRSQHSHWYWTEDIDVHHVYLSDTLVSNVAREVLQRDVTEVRLHDVLKMRDPIVSAAVDAIAREAREQAPGSGLYVEAVATQLCVHLLRRYASIAVRELSAKGGLSVEQRRRVAEHIETRLHEALTLESLSEVAGLGVWSFARRFRASFGQAPHAYVMDRRVERARSLLVRGQLPLKQVASVCGFADQSHMTRALRARLDTTPAALRRDQVDA